MSVSLGNTTAADGTRIFFASEAGEGTPVVHVDPMLYLHASQQTGFQSDLAFTRALSAGAPSFVFDWRGKGASGDGPITYEALLSDLEAVVTEAGGTVDLYGWGPAVPVVVSFAARYPLRVRRLLLALADRFQAHSNFWRSIYPLMAAHRAPAMDALLLAMHETITDSEAKALSREWRDSMPVPSLEAYHRALVDLDLGDVAKEFAVPTVIIAGASNLRSSNEAAVVLPGSRVVLLPEFRSGPTAGIAFREMWDLHCPIADEVSAPSATAQLTRREAEVLDLIVAGHSNVEIAARLTISPSTAARHVANIFAKLGVHNRVQAVQALGASVPRR